MKLPGGDLVRMANRFAFSWFGMFYVVNLILTLWRVRLGVLDYAKSLSIVEWLRLARLAVIAYVQALQLNCLCVTILVYAYRDLDGVTLRWSL